MQRDDDDGNKDRNHLETKILEAAQATRYPPEADQEESIRKIRYWLKHKLKTAKVRADDDWSK